MSFTADACSRVAGLWLEVDQAAPHVLGGVGVVADLSVRVKTEHFRRVGQRQGLDVLLVTSRQLRSTLLYNNNNDNNNKNKLAPYGNDGRLFTTDVSANFKVT